MVLLFQYVDIVENVADGKIRRLKIFIYSAGRNQEFCRN